MSSVILSNQREPVAQQVAGVKNDKKLIAENPLIDNGLKLVPNVTKVFRPAQNMLVYVEVYDPAIPATLPENFRSADVEASVALYQNGKKYSKAPRSEQLAERKSRRNTARLATSSCIEHRTRQVRLSSEPD